MRVLFSLHNFVIYVIFVHFWILVITIFCEFIVADLLICLDIIFLIELCCFCYSWFLIFLLFQFYRTNHDLLHFFLPTFFFVAVSSA